jgi:hypothetical protein
VSLLEKLAGSGTIQAPDSDGKVHKTVALEAERAPHNYIHSTTLTFSQPANTYCIWYDSLVRLFHNDGTKDDHHFWVGGGGPGGGPIAMQHMSGPISSNCDVWFLSTQTGRAEIWLNIEGSGWQKSGGFNY